MAYIFRTRLWLSVVVLCLYMFCCYRGSADETVPQTGTGVAGGAGSIGGDPAEIVAKALLCFDNKYIYSSCDAAYRLTEHGNINVPPEYVDLYCNGPCLAETQLVLSCIENIMTNFEFYNRATTQDIRTTIKAGCGYGAERGDFNVAEHLQADENSGCRTSNQNLFGFGLVIVGLALWF